MESVLRQTSGIKPGNRLDILKVLLTIGIVCRHATMTGLAGATPVFKGVTQGLIWITEICVPLFYALSGYLYFHNAPRSFDFTWFGKKYKSRLFSLVIPYLIANIVAWCCFVFAIKFVPSMIDGFMGDNWKDPFFVFWKGPVNLSLWFIRELIIVVILSPLVWLLVRYTRWFGVLVLGILWGCKIGPAPLFFFSLGAYFAMWKIGAVEEWLHTPAKRVTTRSRAWNYFIYLYHYLLLIGVKKGLCKLIEPSGTFSQLGIYFGSILIVLVALTLLYMAMRRIMPRLTSFIVGGKA